MIDFQQIFSQLSSLEVRFIIVGGVAATVHGSSRLTQDLDLVYARDRENLERLVRALASHEPYLRGAPPGLPFRFDEPTLQAGLNFALTTDLGPMDLLGEITGGGRFEDLVDRTVEISLFGLKFSCLDLETLITVKRAAGRPKDLETVAELESIRDTSES